jgi:hypothetical protein
MLQYTYTSAVSYDYYATRRHNDPVEGVELTVFPDVSNPFLTIEHLKIAGIQQPYSSSTPCLTSRAGGRKVFR